MHSPEVGDPCLCHLESGGGDVCVCVEKEETGTPNQVRKMHRVTQQLDG